MCEALPGDRCPSDTRQVAEETLAAYALAFQDMPERPSVATLVSATVKLAQIEEHGRPERLPDSKARRIERYAAQLGRLRERNPQWSDEELQAHVAAWRDEKIQGAARRRIKQLEKRKFNTLPTETETKLRAQISELGSQAFRLEMALGRQLAERDEEDFDPEAIKRKSEALRERARVLQQRVDKMQARRKRDNRALRELHKLQNLVKTRPAEPTTEYTWDRVPARHLRPGQIISTGETVTHAYRNSKTPRGKITVELVYTDKEGQRLRKVAHWNPSTMISVREVAPPERGQAPESDVA